MLQSAQPPLLSQRSIEPGGNEGLDGHAVLEWQLQKTRQRLGQIAARLPDTRRRHCEPLSRAIDLHQNSSRDLHRVPALLDFFDLFDRHGPNYAQFLLTTGLDETRIDGAEDFFLAACKSDKTPRLEAALRIAQVDPIQTIEFSEGTLFRYLERGHPHLQD